jgi:hypothetical protein
MDLFDVLSALFLPAGASRRRRSPTENLAAAIALFLMPMIDMGLIVLLHLKDPTLLCVVLPLVFGGLAYLSCRLFRVSIGYALAQALGSAGTCFLIGGCIVVLTVMTWGY